MLLRTENENPGEAQAGHGSNVWAISTSMANLMLEIHSVYNELNNTTNTVHNSNRNSLLKIIFKFILIYILEKYFNLYYGLPVKMVT